MSTHLSSQAPSPCGRSKMPAHALTLTKEFSGPSAVRWSLLRVWPYLQTLSGKFCYLGWSSASLTSEGRALTAQTGCVAGAQGRRGAGALWRGMQWDLSPCPDFSKSPLPPWEMRRLDEKDLYCSYSSSIFVRTTIPVTSFP